jgi:hypothetical protein
MGAAASITSSITPTPCTVEVLTCASNKSRLFALKELATKQLARNAGEFESPLPWDYDFCRFRPHGVHFVAVSGTIVCGWATLSIETYEGVPTFEVEAITTRRIRMGDQRIGRILHDTIVSYGTAHGLHYIFLHAASVAVAETYTKWGYKKVFESDNSFTIPDSIVGDAVEKYRDHVHQMMMYPLRPSVELTKNFKKMLQKDAEMFTIHGSYGGNYRDVFKGVGGSKMRRTRRLPRQQRRRSA